MEQVKELLKALKTDPRAKELIGEADPETKEEMIQILSKLSDALGFSLTTEQIEEGIDKITEEMKEETASAENNVEELEIDELSRVAGGLGGKECVETYDPNENCDFTDRCETAFRSYMNEKNCKASWECNWVLM